METPLSSSATGAGTGWQNNTAGSRFIKLSCEEQTFELALIAKNNTITVEFSADDSLQGISPKPVTIQPVVIKIVEQSKNTLKYLSDDVVRTVVYSETKGEGDSLGCDQVHLAARYGNLTFTDISLQSAKKNKGGSDQVLASMDGGMVDVMVKVGDAVAVGQTLAVLEAMKMDLESDTTISDGKKEKLLTQINKQEEKVIEKEIEVAESYVEIHQNEKKELLEEIAAEIRKLESFVIPVETTPETVTADAPATVPGALPGS